MSFTQIHIHNDSPIVAPLLKMFGEAFQAEFLPFACDGGVKPSIWIGNRANLSKANLSQRIFIAPAECPRAGEEISAIEICGAIPGRPWLTGQTLNLTKNLRVAPLNTPPGSEILAFSKAGPVWVRHTVNHTVVDRVALTLPEIKENRPVFEWANSKTFPQLLPLIQFIREATGEHDWKSYLKACFMFDDPNLHASSYGYIPFRQLANHAREFRYHVSLATIPLDSWFISSKAAALFRANKDYLSLLIHGNDHVYQELAQNYDAAERQALLGQALRRIKHLEHQSGVDVSRVMAAPHGACKGEMIHDMARYGFDAACISHGSAWFHNQNEPWSKSIGLQPTELINGLPIIPRFGIAKDNFQSILWAAFLDQPIIPVGHHGDVASGLELLDDLAHKINRLGQIDWFSMSEITKANFQWKMNRDTYVIKPYSKLVRILVPEGVTQLQVELSHASNLFSNRCLIIKSENIPNKLGNGESIAVRPGEVVWLKPEENREIDYRKAPSPPRKLWPIFRRVASEIRDRSKPWTAQK